MADPITLAMVGAAAGAALKPKNPLQGAMLGAATGFTGGAALGAGAGVAGAGAAGGLAGGTGLTAAGGTGLGLAGAGGTGLTAAGAGSTGLGLAGSTGLGLAAPTAATTGYGLTSAAAPTFMQQLGGAGSYLANNPMQTLQAANSVQGLLTPEQAPQAQPGQVQRGQPLPPVDFAALLNPQQYKPQPISLLG
jgi:hypothetical protein